MAKKEKVMYYGTGRRKSAIAKVTLIPGSGKITVNGKDAHEYFPFETAVMDLVQPLDITETRNNFDVIAEVKGGGFSGQAGAIRLGIAKALVESDLDNADKDNNFRKTLKAAGFITRDARIKERKKYGLKKARRAPQFSKR